MSQKSHKQMFQMSASHQREKEESLDVVKSPGWPPPAGEAGLEVAATKGRGRRVGGASPDPPACVPCSSRIPLGIFLSLALTVAFLCFLNLRHRHVRFWHRGPRARSPGSGTHQVSREKLFLLLMAEPLPPSSLCPTARHPLPLGPTPRRHHSLWVLISSSEQTGKSAQDTPT